MLAKQYSIALPADYDMGIVRERVATRGSALDALPHLGFKAYLIAEKGKYGSKENLYAPFYVWRSEEGMLDFLMGSMFAGLTQSFGWPAVRTWAPFLYSSGRVDSRPVFATRQIVPISPHTDLAALRAQERESHRDSLRSPAVHARTVALGMDPWEIVRFTLWNEPLAETGDPATQGYEILHFSHPEFALLSTRS